MGVASFNHDIATQTLVIPISKVENGKKNAFIAITADGTLDSGNTRANMEEGNNSIGVDSEWNQIDSLPGPFLVISGTILIKVSDFQGAFLRCKLAGAATAGILTIKTFYK